MDNPQKTDADWRNELTPEQYEVLRERAQEPPFSGALLDEHGDGSYCCAACGVQLFGSGTKFDSQSGWPSFYDALPGAVTLQRDTSHGMIRTEVECANCNSHLGHLFEGEGYENPTDKRYCVNSLSLNFIPKDPETEEEIL